MHVDDTLFTGMASFLKIEEAQAHHFLIKPFSTIGTEPVQLNGTFLFKIIDGFMTSQPAYIEAITETETVPLAKKFAFVRGKIAYATNQIFLTQSCRLNMLSQIPSTDVAESAPRRPI